MNTKEIMGSMTSASNQITSQNILPENDLSVVNNIKQFIFETVNKNYSYVSTIMRPKTSLCVIVNNIIKFIFKAVNKNHNYIRQEFLDYSNNQNINLQEIYNWLSNDQNHDSNSIFLLGFFNLYKIETRKNYKMAFNLFVNASERDHILAQYFVGYCYYYGYGTSKNYSLAFEYYEKIAYKDCAVGQLLTGYCYGCGFGANPDLKLAFYWYEKAANNGNIVSMYYLGHFYKIGKGVEKDRDRAIYWYKKSAEQGFKCAQKRLEELMKTK